MVATAALLAVAVSPAAAAERPDRSHGIFFNRPGATLDAMIADREGCAAVAKGTSRRVSPVPVPNLVGFATAGLLSGITAARARRVNIENCMVIRGWRLFAFTAEEGRGWNALPADRQVPELAALIAAQTPARGSLLRAWHNDYAEPVFWQKP